MNQQIDRQPKKPGYSQFYWIFFLVFPFMMQGFKTEEIAGNSPIILPIEAQLINGDKAVDLEVARTKLDIARGLTFRESKDMADDRGMLYAGDFTSDTAFSGKDNKFATDILFLNGNRVAYIDRVEACDKQRCLEHRTNQPYDRVVEVKAGIANKLKIAVGSTVEIRFIPRR
ncbi:DUF192 domain-containing protein [Chamaesiphon polymorphus]|uniref:DUF192 domain-containing protein n=1 Tax=Chamaesiphon polymorphus CCALA 037 TaxID=2107692 RepID=A0A2T1GMN7_9CYAN|nr:DUF192 domain-containing protein [Chamaesiphon polymorphus]PSB59138.1 hypothetical protein C7B77_02075 [Chamaesiphon polymorphus CCALA 037]